MPRRLRQLKDFESHRRAEDDGGHEEDAPGVGEGEDEADEPQRRCSFELRRQRRNRTQVDRREGHDDKPGEEEPGGNT